MRGMPIGADFKAWDIFETGHVIGSFAQSNQDEWKFTQNYRGVLMSFSAIVAAQVVRRSCHMGSRR
jgi:hypothetical protein